ncbi:hypothetical protein BGZ65_011932 [Modicella reniformis]|uniref:Uncharacterized protein n=1 Tax=Modicella reniformis TaxID=1440133 RepID=A0A9P6M2E8_9FUNG|nr:hypothetical protein BGZ65_011932 [Modicella reniformis]
MITLKGFAVELEEKSEKADSVDIVKPETYILKSDTSGIKTAAISCGLVDPKDDTSVARANLIRKTDHELALNNAVDAAKEGLVNPQDYFKKTALEAEAKKADQRGDITPDALVALTQAKDNALAEQERLKQRLDNQIRLAEVAEAKCLELEEALDAQRADIDEAGLTALTQAKDDALAAQLKAEQERDARPATTLKLEQIEALQTRPTQETLDNANQAKEQAEQDLADKQTEIETKDNEIATLIRAKALAETTIKDLEAKIKAKDLEIAQLNEDKGLQNPEGHICLEDHTVKEKLEE